MTLSSELQYNSVGHILRDFVYKKFT